MKRTSTLLLPLALVVATACSEASAASACDNAAALKAQVAALNLEYNGLTSKKDAGKKQALKRQIVQVQTEFDQAKQACGICS